MWRRTSSSEQDLLSRSGLLGPSRGRYASASTCPKRTCCRMRGTLPQGQACCRSSSVQRTMGRTATPAETRGGHGALDQLEPGQVLEAFSGEPADAVVYFVKRGPYVKIGTTRHLRNRLSGLQAHAQRRRRPASRARRPLATTPASATRTAPGKSKNRRDLEGRSRGQAVHASRAPVDVLRERIEENIDRGSSRSRTGSPQTAASSSVTGSTPAWSSSPITAPDQGAPRGLRPRLWPPHPAGDERLAERG
jgi:hypothetical protein